MTYYYFYIEVLQNKLKQYKSSKISKCTKGGGVSVSKVLNWDSTLNVLFRGQRIQDSWDSSKVPRLVGRG